MKKNRPKGVAVIGEGETEWYYFDSLRVFCRFPFKMVPSLPQHSDIRDITKLVESRLSEGYDYIFVVVDMDRILTSETENRKYRKAKAKYSKKKYNGQVMFFETNPCTEFWFLLHFLIRPVQKEYSNVEQLVQELQKYMPDYEKSQKYFIKTNLYKYLKEKGDIERAKENSEKICRMVSRESGEDRAAYSQIHRLLQRLDGILQESK